MEIVLTDEWPSLMWRVMAAPWPLDPQKLKLMTPLGTDNGRLEFTDGDWSGQAWGLQHWVPYEVSTSGEVEFVDSDDIKFWIPTIKYSPSSPIASERRTSSSTPAMQSMRAASITSSSLRGSRLLPKLMSTNTCSGSTVKPGCWSCCNTRCGM